VQRLDLLRRWAVPATLLAAVACLVAPSANAASLAPSAASANAARLAPSRSSATKVFKPYAKRWYANQSDLEIRRFTEHGRARIEWGGSLPCTSSSCPFKIRVKFTTRRHTSTRLHGRVTRVNHLASTSFKVGERVKLYGRPSSRHLVFESPNADSAQLCRTIHASRCNNPMETRGIIAASALPVIYAKADFKDEITKAKADGEEVKIDFSGARGEKFVLTVTSSPWATWAANDLDAPNGSVDNGIGDVTGLGTVLNNNAFVTRDNGVRYADCFTYLRGSTPTSLHYTESGGWEVASPQNPCPAP
jgi:hypothetical protein